jgi:RimJ/RimL family protein N-acetyltransferase
VIRPDATVVPHARILDETDRPALDAFLLRHADSSMIIRGNLHLQGVVDRGERFQGPYAGTFDAHGALRAVVVHYRRGNVLAAADDEAAIEPALRATLAASGRPVTGLLGLRAWVRRMRTLLALDAAPVQTDKDEGLFALELARLRVPPRLLDPEVEFRAPRPEDRELMVGWACAYEIETLGGEDTPELAQHMQREFDEKLTRGERCLLTHAGVPCATTGFNARLPDAVQIGGVYTPLEQRSRGFARAAVAASLLDARERGAQRASLFTGEENVPAIKAYRALGFERVGDYTLTLFR